MTDGGARWSVGALAKASGLTVRALHHYDELGLLRPSARTESGHRRYTEADLRRLYQIRLLRELGIPLDDIAELLTDPTAVRDVLARRLEQIEDEQWRLSLLGSQVRNLMEQVDGSWRPDSGELLAQIGRASVFHDGLSREQRTALAEQSDRIGPDARRWLDAEWPLVLTRLAEHCRAGTPPEDPEVQATARRLVDVVAMFTGGDQELVTSVAGFFREHGHGMLRDARVGQPDLGLGDELWDYVSQVYGNLAGN
ncbi:MerR family transcriptional regulator [Actinokineospora sp. NBRC 105648]|uniref:MerR family transcriptional regulator n=1 Tax=Actinokineospora sp. NBRC 105648 TaxID=3032206 RepID=UPI0024A0B1E3|nr:MerR family transcriptional regulator [Actinokineospora sp. NBRC 105648]GLZ39412.1 hypothetical protein Acsp05_30360 [Actinokineospora sp. NBRC 105648]